MLLESFDGIYQKHVFYKADNTHILFSTSKKEYIHECKNKEESDNVEVTTILGNSWNHNNFIKGSSDDQFRKQKK